MGHKDTWKYNGQYNGNSHFTEEDVREIRTRVRNGQSRVEVANLKGCAKVTIDKIMTGQTFCYVPDVPQPRLDEIRAAEASALEHLREAGLVQKVIGRLPFMEE